MSPHQLLDARAQGCVGTARMFEEAHQLVDPFAVQGFEKNRLGIGLHVIHGSSPIIVLYSMPRLWRNPPRNVGKINRRPRRRPDTLPAVSCPCHERSPSISVQLWFRSVTTPGGSGKREYGPVTILLGGVASPAVSF